MERTLVLIKPDAVERGLIGEIISIYEKKGIKITAMKMVKADKETAQNHYEEHKDRSYFKALISYITRSPIVALILEGDNAVEQVRMINGATDPRKQDMGSIRGRYAVSYSENTVHSSDSIEHAEREINIWFPEI
ncbi:MAG: nucleoside-diphosphate kinase [Bacillota bacterium]|nr:nucleoside-diphosphate kinase [Bacillota bacterium]